MQEIVLELEQLKRTQFSKDKRYDIFFDLKVKNLKNIETGKEIIEFCSNLKNQGINYEIINSLPKCIFSCEDNLKTKRLGLCKNCFECKKLFRIAYSNQVGLCNGERVKLIDEYKHREELYIDFVKLHKNHKVPKICQNCPEKDNCSYGCIYRKQTLPSFYKRRELVDYSVPRNTSFLKKVSKGFFRPTRIFCFPTYNCNNDCLYCFAGDKSKRSNPDLDFLKKMIKKASKDFDWINFGGGEPTMYKHILELIELAKNKGLKVQMFSNGRRFANKEFAKSIVEAGVDLITEVFHSYKSEVHDFITQREGSFNQMRKGIDNLHSLGFYGLHTMVVVHKQNYRELLKLTDFLLFFKPKALSFEALVLGGQTVKNFNTLAVKLAKTTPSLEEAWDFLIDRKISFRVNSFPLCLFKDRYWRYFVNHRYYLSATNFPFDDSEGRWALKTNGLGLGTKCIDCTLKKYCPGTRLTYYSFFGDDELLLYRKPLNVKKLICLDPRGVVQGLIKE